MLGIYVRRQGAGWRRKTQALGSGLLIASLALLIAAFLVEPGRGFHEETWWSHLGLYALFGGSMAHLASAIDEKT
jgi:hypothetical protein